jgi:peptidoglycan hydrolase-like protein with peptidoglycan-binding domain
MKSEMVEYLQKMLISLGYYKGALDGIFGPITEGAVKAFRKEAGLPVKGIADLQMFEQLFKRTGMFPGTEHFDFAKEFDRPHRPEKAKYWTPCPVLYYANTQELFFRLEKLRAELNRLYAGEGQEVKILIRSGYRGPAYNRACNGAKKSRHLFGEAADLYAVRVSNDGTRADHVPNCYQIGKVIEVLLSKGGRGHGSNSNNHYDIRPGLARWWYRFKNWVKWKASQGVAA